MRIILISIGTLSVGLAFLGVVLPLLPTTPFLLLAAACYAKSSDKFYNWLLDNRWFGEYIRNYRAGRGIPARTKALAVTLLVLAIGYSAIFAAPVFWVKILLVSIAVGVSLHIVLMPTLIFDQGGDKE